MVRRNEFHRKNENQATQPQGHPGGSSQPSQRFSHEPQINRENMAGRENQINRENQGNRENPGNRENQISRENSSIRENQNNRENQRPKNFYRENQQRQNFQSQQTPRYSNRVKPVETVEDIQIDIQRIEKEIELEIKEIKSMRLGL